MHLKAIDSVQSRSLKSPTHVTPSVLCYLKPWLVPGCYRPTWKAGSTQPSFIHFTDTSSRVLLWLLDQQTGLIHFTATSSRVLLWLLDKQAGDAVPRPGEHHNYGSKHGLHACQAVPNQLLPSSNCTSLSYPNSSKNMLQWFAFSMTGWSDRMKWQDEVTGWSDRMKVVTCWEKNSHGIFHRPWLQQVLFTCTWYLSQ